MNVLINLINLNVIIACKLQPHLENVPNTCTAVSYSPYILKLYQMKKTAEGLPSNPDLAVLNPFIRQNICRNIMASGYFGSYQWLDLTEPDKFNKIKDHPKYSEIFSHIYHFNNETNSYTYTNSFFQREFTVEGPHCLKEFVFICLHMDLSVDEARIIPFYVSREYHVAPYSKPYKPGRFFVGNFLIGLLSGSPEKMMLAEEPAKVHNELGFNVERYYIQIRKLIRRQARDNHIDPLCRLFSDSVEPDYDQHYRLCVAVLRSSYFKQKRYPYPKARSRPCQKKKISFRTEETSPYYELMTLCHVPSYDRIEKENFVYISRAYNSGEVFVYLVDRLDGNLYLENLSTNVAILDELNSFDFLEN